MEDITTFKIDKGVAFINREINRTFLMIALNSFILRLDNEKTDGITLIMEYREYHPANWIRTSPIFYQSETIQIL